jgi:predicted metal-dependent HD superfamily phosphohydrolase
MTLLSASQLNALHQRYAEPGRAYHNWQHIEAMLRWRHSGAFQLHDEDAVYHAIILHDAIYDPAKQDNEELSAQLAEELLSPLYSDNQVAGVATMIRATARHEMLNCPDKAAEQDMAHFLDMDLSILGASWAIFEVYEANIRQEYSIYPDAAFWPGRAAVLERFLNRERLYFSEWGFDSFETKARANLAKAIDLAKQKSG